MSALKVTVLLFVLASLISDVYCQKLECLCTGNTCNGDVTPPCDPDQNEVCYAAEIRLKNGTIQLDKGCRPIGECDDIGFCRYEEGVSVCAKFGCCNYTRCVVNYTSGVDFMTSSPTPTSTLILAPSSTMKAPVVSSSDIVEGKSSIVPMATKETKAPVLMPTSSFAAKMTSEPVMPSSESKMSTMKPMTSSAQPEVMPSESMEKNSTSSPVDKVKPGPSRVASMGVYQSVVLHTVDSRDSRPPCDASERMLSFGAFLLTAIALLCGLMELLPQ